jgi:hypothetical protein
MQGCRRHVVEPVGELPAEFEPSLVGVAVRVKDGVVQVQQNRFRQIHVTVLKQQGPIS